MVLKRCASCPANEELWKWRLTWTGDSNCIMEECRQPEQTSCAYCPIHMQLRTDYREKGVSFGKKPRFIRCVEDDLVFASQSQAAEYYGVAQASIAQVVDRETRSLKGAHFVSWSCFKCAELHKGNTGTGA